MCFRPQKTITYKSYYRNNCTSGYCRHVSCLKGFIVCMQFFKVSPEVLSQIHNNSPAVIIIRMNWGLYGKCTAKKTSQKWLEWPDCLLIPVGGLGQSSERSDTADEATGKSDGDRVTVKCAQPSETRRLLGKETAAEIYRHWKWTRRHYSPSAVVSNFSTAGKVLFSFLPPRLQRRITTELWCRSLVGKASAQCTARHQFSGLR